MPGLFGIINLRSSYDNEESLGEVFNKINFSQRIMFIGNNYRLVAVKNSRQFACHENNRIFLLYEGVFLNYNGNEKGVAQRLHEKYLHEGEKFVKDLRGSFQIFIIDANSSETKYLLYCDHTASRQIFYSITNDRFLFSPDIELLVTNTIDRTMDKTSMVHFMIVGHFPSGHTAIKEIKVLGPGEYLILKGKILAKYQYFHFKLEPDEKIDKRFAIKKLDAVLTKKILEHWRHADDPAILLSGGYDSQFIFYTIANSVSNTGKLTTVTWGQNPRRLYADMSVARRIAARFKTKHIEILKTLDQWRAEYDQMFIAQNGMTDSCFYHAHELTVCKNLRDRYGIRSIFRGDECLGYGPEAFSLQSALIANSMSLPEFIPGLSELFFEEHHIIIDHYSSFIYDLVNNYQSKSYDCLKDELDFYERQHMNRNPLNYYKLHFVDVFCPLLDPDVLNLFSKLPAKFRSHKMLFKELLKSKFNSQLEIAQYTNLTNWGREISRSIELKKFFVQEFAFLPSFLNCEFFSDLTLSLIHNRTKDIKFYIKNFASPLKHIPVIDKAWKLFTHKSSSADLTLNIPPQMLIMRAAVLARWNKLWIKNN